jgi:hypothetical protein
MLIQLTREESGETGGIDQQALEGMIEIPIVDDMLVIPNNLVGLRVRRERRVVIEILLVVASRNLGAGEVTEVPM